MDTREVLIPVTPYQPSPKIQGDLGGAADEMGELREFPAGDKPFSP